MTRPVSGPAHQPPDGAPTTRGYLLAALALIASLTLVLMYWHNAKQRELRAVQNEFITESAEMAGKLRQRLANYHLVSQGAVSLFASVEQPSVEQWHDYVEALRIGQEYPALVGLGYATYLGQKQLQDLQLAARDSGQGYFSLRPPGVRQRYGPVTYLEPRTAENLKVIGYDMYAEPVRRQAMDAARDAAEARVTGAVRLLHDRGSNVRGLLMYSPVYRRGIVPDSVNARRDALQGWVYAPFRVHTLVETSLGAGQRRIHMRIVDLIDGGAELYVDPPMAGMETGDLLEYSSVLDAFGRRWRLDFRAHAGTALGARSSDLPTTLAIGVLASLLLFGIAMALARTERQAQAMAARMSESYRRSELRFRNAMEYSAIGKALLDRAGIMVDVNPALVAIFGSTRERLMGLPFGAQFGVGGNAEEDGEDVMRTREMDAVVDGVYRDTRRLRRENGELRDVQLTFAPVPGEIGQGVARLVQVEDVTERLRAEARVRDLNRSLEARVALRTRELTQANHELESFAYSVSHDLRAPLRAIDGFSRLLVERHAQALGESGLDYLARIRKASGRMDELIGSMLKMARLSRVELKLATLDLSQLAREVVAELRMAEPDRHVEVVVHPGLRAAGDATLARNLLQNLLGNAWKFTGEVDDAVVEFGASMDPGTGTQVFFVRDNGAGFAPEYAGKLFRPFQRLHSQEQFAGHGIGLASVKRIVERHGGSIHAEGRLGEGATFYFTLPGVVGTD